MYGDEYTLNNVHNCALFVKYLDILRLKHYNLYSKNNIIYDGENTYGEKSK